MLTFGTRAQALLLECIPFTRAENIECRRSGSIRRAEASSGRRRDDEHVAPDTETCSKIPRRSTRPPAPFGRSFRRVHRRAPHETVRRNHATSGENGCRHRLEESHARRAPSPPVHAPLRRSPSGWNASSTEREAELEHSGSVIRELVMCVCTAAVPSKPGPGLTRSGHDRLPVIETIAAGSCHGPASTERRGADAHDQLTDDRSGGARSSASRFWSKSIPIRTGSGGAGRWTAVMAPLAPRRFLEPMTAAILAGRRVLRRTVSWGLARVNAAKASSNRAAAGRASRIFGASLGVSGRSCRRPTPSGRRLRLAGLKPERRPLDVLSARERNALE